MLANKASHDTGGESIGSLPGNSNSAEQKLWTGRNPKRIYAGFWRRLLAALLDCLALSIGQMIVVAILLIIVYLIFLLMRLDLGAFGSIAYSAAFIIYLPTLWLYFTLFESSTLMATIGKLALSIVVTDTEYERITFGRANGRFWSKAISFYSLFVGFILIAFTKRKQGIHDFVAGTVVIKKAMIENAKMQIEPTQDAIQPSAAIEDPNLPTGT
jgi:uncharacterized RDD family membrane protein YckC